MERLAHKISNFKFSKALISKRPEWVEYDAIKGILMTLIVLGHARSLNGAYLEFQKILYNFHAPLFLLIVFIVPTRPFSFAFVKARLKRYFAPILWFSLFAFLVFNFVLGGEGASLLASTKNYGLAWLTGTAHYFNVSTGFEAFWFMHALFGIFLLRSISGLGGIGLQVGMVFLCVLSLYGVSYHLPIFIKLPTVLTISAYCIVMSVPVFAFSHVLSDRLPKGLGLIVACGLFAGISTYFAVTHKTYNIAHLRVPDLFDLIDTTLFILLLGSALSAIIMFARMPRLQPFFQAIGSLSFEIYLIHLFVLFLVEKMLIGLGLNLLNLTPLIALFLITGILTFIIAKISRKIPAVGTYIFTR